MPWIKAIARWSASLAFAAGLFAAAVEIGLLGIKDTRGALTYAGRVGGVVFIIACLVEVMAFFSFVLPSRNKAKYAGDVIMLGVWIPLFVNIALLALQFGGRDDGSSLFVRYFWIWVIFIAWSGGFLWYLLSKKAWVRISAPRGVAIGAAVTALLGIANFTYAQIYEPYASPPMVSVTVEFGKISNKGGVASFPLRLHVRNTGKVGVYGIGSLYQVSARKNSYRSIPVPKRNWRVALSNGQHEVSRYSNVKFGGYEQLGQGQFMMPGRKLEPGSKYTSEKVIQLPLHSLYDTITANGAIVYMRKDRALLTKGDDFLQTEQYSWDRHSYRHKVNAPGWVANRGVDYISYNSQIVHASTMTEWTRNTRFVTLWWVLEHPTKMFPFRGRLVSTIASTGREKHEPTPAQRQMVSNRYGLNQVSSGTVTKSLVELMHS